MFCIQYMIGARELSPNKMIGKGSSDKFVLKLQNFLPVVLMGKGCVGWYMDEFVFQARMATFNEDEFKRRLEVNTMIVYPA